jgi:hypothetical protein
MSVVTRLFSPMRACEYCGRKNPDDVEFCTGCGTSLSNPSQSATSSPTSVEALVAHRAAVSLALAAMHPLIEFIFPGRLHRLAYFLRVVTTDILACFIYAFGGTNASSVWLVLLFFGLAVYQLFFIILPRIRDLGMSNWWLLLIFVPGVNVVFGIILLFRAPAILSDRRNPALQTTATPQCG